MKINALRKELSAILDARKPVRKPALRRSRQDEWLYATDILQLVSREERKLLQKELSAAGWDYDDKAEHGWLSMKKEATEPPEDWYEGKFGPEASSCASLLERHPNETDYTDETVQRALIKAGEKGEKAYEATCRKIHQKWAENLRNGEPIPVFRQGYFRK